MVDILDADVNLRPLKNQDKYTTKVIKMNNQKKPETASNYFDILSNIAKKPKEKIRESIISGDFNLEDLHQDIYKYNPILKVLSYNIKWIIEENSRLKERCDILEKKIDIKGEINDITKSIKNILEKEIIEKDITEIKKENKKTNKRQHINKSTRYFILKQAGFKCQCCGKKPAKENEIELHIDHIIPKSKGGKDDITNYQVLCNKCNISKSNFDDVDLSIKELN